MLFSLSVLGVSALSEAPVTKVLQNDYAGVNFRRVGFLDTRRSFMFCKDDADIQVSQFRHAPVILIG